MNTESQLLMLKSEVHLLKKKCITDIGLKHLLTHYVASHAVMYTRSEPKGTKKQVESQLFCGSASLRGLQEYNWMKPATYREGLDSIKVKETSC